mgnify:CR=1 FL=1
MNPQSEFCPNKACPDRGKVGAGNIVSHSQKEKRCRCKTCGKTFTVTTGTALYGLKTSHETVERVVTLLAHGCPVQAVVVAYGLDERTVRSWLVKAGTHCEAVHDHIVGRHQSDLGQVQADEIKVKTQRGTIWMAMAIVVMTRLWVGGQISPTRDKTLLTALVERIRKLALCRPLLLAVDGLPGYADVFRKAFRTPLRTGKRGRPRFIAWTDIHIVQVVKRRNAGGLTVGRRIAQGHPNAVDDLLQRSQSGGVINTAFIERLNATFRQSLAPLTRRTRCLARQSDTLQAGMFLVGTVYNLCTYHQSLRLKLWITPARYRWVQRTPAMASGLSDHRWSVGELLTFKVPPSPSVPPKRRGRKPKPKI